MYFTRIYSLDLWIPVIKVKQSSELNLYLTCPHSVVFMLCHHKIMQTFSILMHQHFRVANNQPETSGIALILFFMSMSCIIICNFSLRHSKSIDFCTTLSIKCWKIKVVEKSNIFLIRNAHGLCFFFLFFVLSKKENLSKLKMINKTWLNKLECTRVIGLKEILYSE